MTRPHARRLMIGLIVAYTIALLWPGVMLANRFRPTVFGLPFTLVWVAAWIVIGFVVLLLIDRGLYGAGTRAGRDEDA